MLILFLILLIFGYSLYKYTFKTIVVLILSLMLGVMVLYITNPTEEQFYNYYVQQIDEEKTDSNLLVNIGLEALKLQGKMTLVRENRYIFSVYQVNQGNEKVLYIGICGNFIRD